MDTETLAIQPNVYYTVEEAAQLLRVSQRNVLRMLRSRQTRGIKIGRQWRILGANLLDLSFESPEIMPVKDVRSNSLWGTPVRYDEPFEPVALEQDDGG